MTTEQRFKSWAEREAAKLNAAAQIAQTECERNGCCHVGNEICYVCEQPICIECGCDCEVDDDM